MDGIHDLGGVEGFGAIDHTPSEPPFHAPWEGRVHGMMLALGASGNMPPWFRAGIERMGAEEYLATSYYEHWLHAVETLLTESGAVSASELEAARARAAAGDDVAPRHDPTLAANVRSLFHMSGDAALAIASGRFQPGDAVRVRRDSPRVHSRCPRYVRGARGEVLAVRTQEELPEAALLGRPRREATYTVRFRSDELWGSGGEPCTVTVDLYESHLEEAG